MVILRRDIGYRLLNPAVLMAVFGLLAVVAILATPGNEDARPVDLLIFAVLGFFCGIAQRIRRWWDLERNVRQHSYYIGNSRFDQRWLPAFFRRNRRAARIIEPLFCAAVGFILLPYSRSLAIWLIFSGFCLRAYEDTVYRRERSQRLDTMDSLIESEIQGEHVEQFEPSMSDRSQQTAPGLPTGLGNDIQERIKRNKQNNPPLN